MKSRKNLNAAMRKPEILEGYYNVLIREGLENTSISKIAKELGIHSSLIFHYFQNKENLTFELVQLMIEKYKSVHLLDFDNIADPRERYEALLNLLFSLQWSRTVDPGVHFGFYYQSFRDQRTLEHLREMFAWLRDYLEEQLVFFSDHGIITVKDPRKAADYIVTMMEGLEFHAQFLQEDKPFDHFAASVRDSVHLLLASGGL